MLPLPFGNGILSIFNHVFSPRFGKKVNYSIISRLLGIILCTEGLAFLLSLSVGLAFGSSSAEEGAIEGFGICAMLSFGAGAALIFLGGSAKTRIFRREALCVIGLGWVMTSLFGALPYLTILPNCSIADAIFESTSGITTTGASILAVPERLPHSLLFWRAISQWIGGLGILVFFVAILGFIGVGAKILFSGESSAQAADLETARIQTGVKRIVVIYLIFSTLCVYTYRVSGMTTFDAFCHMFTTVSTAGFSTHSESMAFFRSPLIEWICVIFMLLCGTNFYLFLLLIRGAFKEAAKNSECRTYYMIMLCGTLLLVINLLQRGEFESLHDTVRAATFQFAAILTTTGYTTSDFDSWGSMVTTVLLATMVIGGCAGSTAGGIKVVRFIVGLKTCIINIEHSFRTQVVRPLKLDGASLNPDKREPAVRYLLLIAPITLFSALVVAILEPNMSFKGNLSAMFACLFNIGPGFGEVGPTHTYAPLHDYTKNFLSLLMLMGRLELYAILVLFMPSFWRSAS